MWVNPLNFLICLKLLILMELNKILKKVFTYFYLSNIFISIIINNVFVESAHRQIYVLPEYNIDWERFFCSSLMLEPKM